MTINQHVAQAVRDALAREVREAAEHYKALVNDPARGTEYGPTESDLNAAAQALLEAQDAYQHRSEKAEALVAMQEIVDDYFAFQAAACTTQPGCECGRH